MAAKAISVLSPAYSDFRSEIIGHDMGLCNVWTAVQMVSQCDATVLIQGETGTRKELVAKAIHEETLPETGRT